MSIGPGLLDVNNPRPPTSPVFLYGSGSALALFCRFWGLRSEAVDYGGKSCVPSLTF